jgi:hypothetical protein
MRTAKRLKSRCVSNGCSTPSITTTGMQAWNTADSKLPLQPSPGSAPQKVCDFIIPA